MALLYIFTPKSTPADKAGPGPESRRKEVHAYNIIPYVQFDRYKLYLPGDYTKVDRSKKFPVHINKLGFRGEEPSKGEVFRIVILGGSSTAGLESPDNATIAYFLQDLLNKGKWEKPVTTYDQAYYWMHSQILDIMDKFSSEDITVIDPVPEFREGALFCDIVHLTEKGNKRLAQIIAQNLHPR